MKFRDALIYLEFGFLAAAGILIVAYSISEIAALFG